MKQKNNSELIKEMDKLSNEIARKPKANIILIDQDKYSSSEDYRKLIEYGIKEGFFEIVNLNKDKL